MNTQFCRPMEGATRSQQIPNDIDMERQITQPQTASSSETSNKTLPQTFAERYRTSLQKLAKLCEGIRYQQSGEKGDGQYTSAPFSTGLVRPLAMNAPIYERAGQCCFVCFRKRHNQLAIAVPCFRPTKPRQVRYITQRLGSPTRDTKYHDIRQMERAGKSDAAIFARLKWAYFEYQGIWKKWLPFYGIVKVEEVNVRCSQMTVYLTYRP